ncbi:MAG: GntR family transcriptional regulator [Lautropia sp.]
MTAAARITQGQAVEPSPGFVAEAYRIIRQRILDNVYPAGHRALEREFADELGLSRTPVREALLKLEAEGLIELIPRHGARVLPVSASDMAEIYQVLGALESTAAEIVTRRRPAAEALAPLSTASRDMSAALEVNDLDAWARADERFHRSLLDLADNKVLTQTVQLLWDRAHRARMVTLRLRPLPVNSTREHNAIVDAIRAGDPAVVGALYRAHRERASTELLAILERARLSSL